VRRPAVFAVLIGVVAALLRRASHSGRADKHVWTEATAAPDLR
jgi:hypothetical protein